MLSAFLFQESNHDVVVDYTVSVEGGDEKSGENEKVVKGRGRGWTNFMRASEVGTDLKTTVEVKMKWEHISGGVGEQNQVTIRDLVQVEERLGEKLEQMKTFVPVCFLHLKPPKKIVQCLKVGVRLCMDFVSPINPVKRVSRHCSFYQIYLSEICTFL